MSVMFGAAKAAPRRACRIERTIVLWVLQNGSSFYHRKPMTPHERLGGLLPKRSVPLRNTLREVTLALIREVILEWRNQWKLNQWIAGFS
jgi:hypothetical protein